MEYKISKTRPNWFTGNIRLKRIQEVEGGGFVKIYSANDQMFEISFENPLINNGRQFIIEHTDKIGWATHLFEECVRNLCDINKMYRSPKVCRYPCSIAALMRILMPFTEINALEIKKGDGNLILISVGNYGPIAYDIRDKEICGASTVLLNVFLNQKKFSKDRQKAMP